MEVYWYSVRTFFSAARVGRARGSARLNASLLVLDVGRAGAVAAQRVPTGVARVSASALLPPPQEPMATVDGASSCGASPRPGSLDAEGCALQHGGARSSGSRGVHTSGGVNSNSSSFYTCNSSGGYLSGGSRRRDVRAGASGCSGGGGTGGTRAAGGGGGGGSAAGYGACDGGARSVGSDSDECGDLEMLSQAAPALPLPMRAHAALALGGGGASGPGAEGAEGAGSGQIDLVVGSTEGQLQMLALPRETLALRGGVAGAGGSTKGANAPRGGHNGGCGDGGGGGGARSEPVQISGAGCIASVSFHERVCIGGAGRERWTTPLGSPGT